MLQLAVRRWGRCPAHPTSCECMHAQQRWRAQPLQAPVPGPTRLAVGLRPRLRSGLLLPRLLVGRGVVRGLGHVARGVLRAREPFTLQRRHCSQEGSTAQGLDRTPYLARGRTLAIPERAGAVAGRHIYQGAGRWALYSRSGQRALTMPGAAAATAAFSAAGAAGAAPGALLGRFTPYAFAFSARPVCARSRRSLSQVLAENLAGQRARLQSLQ